MAATGFTPISLYYSTTASAVPLAANLANGELALNTADMKLYSKNSAGVVTLLASSGGAAGTVSSVAQSFTGGLISVSGSPITTSGTLALTVAGTSGGIPYFSSASTWATSAALAASSLVVGGGAGAAPSTVTTGTGVVTALGVNTGSAGAFVVNGGALGTPSSGTVTNLTGTASININGTVGATTPTTGAFTTLAASSSVTLSGGTANGVTYLNGSQVLTSGSALTFDGTNLGVNNTSPSSLGRFVVTGSAGSTYVISTGNGLSFSRAGANYIRSSNAASTLVSEAPTFTWFAEDGITERMRLTSTGLGIGTSSPNYLLSVQANSVQMGFSPQSGIGYLGNYSNAPIGFVVNNAEKMRLDTSGNLGLGVTPSAWSTGNAIEINRVGNSLFGNTGVNFTMASGAYYNGGWKYSHSGVNVSSYSQIVGVHAWNVAASGTAGNAISFTQAMTLDASGNWLLGSTSSLGYRSQIFSSTNGYTQALVQTSAYNSGNLAGTVYSGYYDGSSITDMASIRGGKENTTSGNYGGMLAFYTRANGGSDTERARIDSSGNLLVGTTSALSKLTVNGTISSGSAITSAGLFYQSGTNLYIENTDDTGTAGNSQIRFRVRTYGTPITAATIDASGNLLVGTTATAAAKVTIVSTTNPALTLPNIAEIATVSATAATGTINYDLTTQSVLYYTTNASGNFTMNIRGNSGLSLNSMMSTGQSVTMAFLCTNGGTAYYQTAMTIDGTSVTPKWQGGTAPSSGNASSVDIYSYTIIKTGSATYTVFASQTKFA